MNVEECCRDDAEPTSLDDTSAVPSHLHRGVSVPVNPLLIAPPRRRRRTARLALPRATRGALGLTELLGAREDGVDALCRASITLTCISITYMQ